MARITRRASAVTGVKMARLEGKHDAGVQRQFNTSLTTFTPSLPVLLAT
jgi:hypothetical protein